MPSVSPRKSLTPTLMRNCLPGQGVASGKTRSSRTASCRSRRTIKRAGRTSSAAWAGTDGSPGKPTILRTGRPALPVGRPLTKSGTPEAGSSHPGRPRRGAGAGPRSGRAETALPVGRDGGVPGPAPRSGPPGPPAPPEWDERARPTSEPACQASWVRVRCLTMACTCQSAAVGYLEASTARPATARSGARAALCR